MEAAGIAGLIKAVSVLEHGEIPPTLHYTEANPQIDFARTPFFIADRLIPWHMDGPRRASVSSFGIGGTNAHAVLEAWSPPALERFERRTLLALGLTLGGLLALAALNLYSFLALRDRTYLWACPVLATFAGYQLAETGTAAAWLWPGASTWIMVSPALLASLAIA